MADQSSGNMESPQKDLTCVSLVSGQRCCCHGGQALIVFYIITYGIRVPKNVLTRPKTSSVQLLINSGPRKLLELKESLVHL